MSLKENQCQSPPDPAPVVDQCEEAQVQSKSVAPSLGPMPSAVQTNTVEFESPARQRDVKADESCPMVFTSTGAKARKIKGHDLSLYRRPLIEGNRNAAWRSAWYLVNAWFFQSAVLALIPSSWKAGILRAFGARVGQGFVCKPRVTIKYPWFLEIGDHVWLGELVWIDNHTTVKIGNSVCISQGAYLFTGNHDWNDLAFRFSCAPVEISDGCWVGAKIVIGPGTVLNRGTIVTTALKDKE